MKKTREATLIFMLFAVFAAMFSVSSCNRENLIPENQNRSSESEKMHPVRISMEGTLPVGTVKNKVFLIYPNIKNPSASDKAPFIDWSKSLKNGIDATFLLSDGSKHAVIQGRGVVSKPKTPDGNYTIKLEGSGNTSYNVNSQTYVTVLLGADYYHPSDKVGSKTRFDADFGNADYLNPDIQVSTQYGDVHNVGALLTIPWQKANQTSGNFVDIRNLTFQPLGSLIGFKIKSDFVDPVRVRLVQFITNLYSNQFALDLNAAPHPQEGQLISYNASNFLRDNIGGVPHGRYFLNNVPVRTAYSDLNDAQRASIENYVELNSKTNHSLRFADWGLLLQPGASGNSAPYFAAKFAMTRVCRDPFKGKDAWIKDTIEHQGFVVPYQRALWQAKNPPSLESGHSYYAEPTIKDAGLLITEVYYCHPKEGNNYSMVEIYNPSNHDVDLSDYYIGRTIQACDVYGKNPTKREQEGRISAAYCYPKGSEGMVVCSLVPEKVRTLSDSGNVYKYYTENQGGYAIFYKGGDGAFYHKNTLVYNNNMNDTHKLAPGKTLLLAASGYVKDGGNLLDNPHLPHGIKENRESIAAIVAIDNHGTYHRYANKNSPVQIGSAESVNSTMDLDKDSGILLMKVKKEGGTLTHEIVDIYNFGLAQKNLCRDYPAISSFYYASKYDGILYPEIYPANSAKQYYISTNPDGNPISSLGARYRKTANQ